MAFSGTTSSDFMKLASVEDSKKPTFIDYTSLDFISLRDSFIKYIKAVYPKDYQNFSESDLGMMLIEVVAYMGSVMSYKADFNANENFFRTASKRGNVKKLLELVGVKLKGPISAAANARVTMDSAPSGGAVITPTNRVFNITSPEDGGNISFTLYKVVDGLVDVANSTGNVTIDYTGSETVNEDLVLLEGGLVKETGIFDSTEATKSIDLSEFPVVEGSVQVYVEGDSVTEGAYTEVENIFFASGATDKIFQVVSEDDFKGSVVFGDGIAGSSPRAGDTFTVFYRVGGGSRGNISNSLINAIITADVGTGIVENISIGTGGSDAETVDHAKKYAPLTFRRQDRLVTLNDFKSFANSYISTYGSVGKATATVRKAFSSANIVDVFVLEKANDTQLRKATPQFKVGMLASMNLKKMLTDELIVVDGLIRTIDLVVTIRMEKELLAKEEEIKLKVKDKVLSYFSVDSNDFGKTFILSELNRDIFSLPEVRFSTVDNFSDDVQVDFNEIIQLNNLTINVSLV